MLIGDGYTTTPHHRQNRRRERPGSRTRRTITRKSAMQTELSEGLLDAFDIDIQLPSERYNTKPSPLRRQNFELSWQRWKAREAEEKALAEVEKLRLRLELEEEQLRLFGGEVDDDELVRLGILYDGSDNFGPSNSKSISSSVSWALPAIAEHSTRPSFTIRQAKPSRRSRRRSQWQSIPLFLSLSNLRDDHDIARLLAPETTKSTFQHPRITTSIPPSTSSPSPEIISADEQSSPLSLPTTSLPASLSLSSFPISTSVHGFGSGSANSASSSAFPSNSSIPPHSLDMGDWTFITSSTSSSHSESSAMADQGHPSNNDLYSPSSEPETWILLGDDL